MPPRKPIEQHKREGTLRPDRQKTRTPVLIGGRKKPTCPAYLKNEARKAWSMIVADLWDSGVLDRADNQLIIAAACHTAAAIAFHKDLEKRGYNVAKERGGYNGMETRTTLEPNPSADKERASWEAACRAYDKLGIGPAARAQLASLGIKGREPAKELPGIGAQPVKLRVVGE